MTWKLKPQWDTISFAKTKKVWRYTGHGWAHGATGASDFAHLWAHSSLLVFQTLRVVRRVLYKTNHYSDKGNWNASYQNSSYPHCTFVFSPSCFATGWIVFNHPLKGCTPQPERHSFQKHSSVNEKARARLRAAAFFPSLGKMNKYTGYIGLRDD